MIRLHEMIAFGRSELIEKLGDRAHFESRLIAGKALDLKIERLISAADEAVTDHQFRLFKSFVERRKNNEPMAYILEEKEFFKRIFEVGPGVLIPRPESERLVEVILDWMSRRQESQRVAELGVGSGCLLLSLALERQEFQDSFWGWEISSEAISYARRNQRRSNPPRVEIFERDFSDIQNFDSFDVILSNPPYIPSNEWLSLDPEIQTYEPRQALDGGENGITFYKKIYQVAWPRLKPGGLMALETHCERQRAVLMEEIFVSEVKKHWIEDCHLLIEKKD